MQLYYFLAVILSLSLGSLPESDQPIQAALGFSAAIVAVWWILCGLAVRLVGGLINRGEVTADIGYDWFDRQIELLRWFSIGLMVLCLGGFGLGRNLRQLPWIEHSMVIQSIILLTPGIAMMAGLWAAEYYFAARLGYTRKRLLDGLKYVGYSFRCNVGWLILPIMGFMLIADVFAFSSLSDAVPAWAGWVGVAVLVAAGIPVLVRRMFPTIPIDTESKAWIQSVLRSAGICRCKVLMWNTGGQTHNAMIAGLLGRFRVLLLSDRLVSDLTRPELAMVILHEAAHAKRMHIVLRIAALLPVWCVGMGIEHWIATNGNGGWVQSWAGTLGNLFSILATVLMLRFVSYRSEFDADRYACRLAPEVAVQTPDVPANHDEAKRRLSSALLRVTAHCESARKPTWLHPSIADRIAAMTPPAGIDFEVAHSR
ncbi:MAG: M48 family metalloprotease [Planctomycetales bacterium]|nr:M48 family metalloprotease [Planctomycetales bacterium]